MKAQKNWIGILALGLSMLIWPQHTFGVVAVASGKFNDHADRGCPVTPGGPGALPGATVNSGGNQSRCRLCQTGMPVWSISEPYCNLWLSDQPLSYTLSSGQTMAFRWLYEQREHPPGDLGLREWDGAKQTPIRLRGDPYGTTMFTMTNGAWCHNWLSEIVFWDTNFEATAGGTPTIVPPPPSAPTNEYWSFSHNFEGMVYFGEGGSMYFNGGATNQAIGSGKIQVQMVGEVSTNGGPEVPVESFSGAGGQIYAYPLYTNGVSWVSNPRYGFRLLYPDGSQDIYGFVRVNGDRVNCPYGEGIDPRCSPTNGVAPKDYTSRAYLTERLDPQGRSTHLIYTKVKTTNQSQVVTITYPMAYVVDPDGRTNSYYYDPQNMLRLNYIVDAYGRTNTLTYDSRGMVYSLTDGAGLTSSFQYQPNTTSVSTNYGTNSIAYQYSTSSAGWLTNLTTPYGTTRFDYFQEATNSDVGDTRRAVMVSEPNGGHQLYAYVQNAGTLMTNSVPTNTLPAASIGGYTFDSGNVTDPGGKLNVRNSLHWDQRQFLALSSGVTNALLPFYGYNVDMAGALNSLTWYDFQKGRLQHWLVDLDGVTITESVSSQQEPSFDSGGQSPGPRTWFDYAGKQSGLPFEAGTQPLVGCAAQVLPDGSSQFVVLNYSTGGFPTNRYESYTATNSTTAVRTNSYVYAANGVDPVIVQRPASQSVGLAYNSAHQVMRITNALSQIATLGWHPYTFNLTSLALPSGETVTLDYYATNVPGSAPTNKGGLLHSIGFAVEGRTLEVFDYTNGLPFILHATGTGLPELWLTNVWDGLNRLRKTVFTDQTTTTNYYNRLDLAAHKDRLGYWSYYGYDQVRHLTNITDANSKVTSLNWCGCGALESITDPLTNTTSFFYNNQGLLTTAAYPDNSSFTYYYDSISRLTNVVDGAGRSIKAGYNNQGLLTNITSAYGTILQVMYDVLDRPVQVTDANNVRATNTFDLLDRLLTRSWPGGGAVEQLVWSTNGLVSYTDRDQKVTLFTRDGAGRLMGVTNANQEITALGYNGLNQLTDLYDGRTDHTIWHFNQYGWLTNKVDALGREVLRYTNDANGQIVGRWTPQSTSTTYGYDGVGNLTSIGYPGSSTPSVTYVYDGVNRLKTMIDGLGTHTFTYLYTNGEIRTEIGTWSSDGVTNVYANQLRQAMNLAQPNGGIWSQTYGYDNAWRLSSLVSPAGSFGYGYTVDQTVSPAANVRSVALPNGAFTTNHFDGLGRMDFTGLLDHWGHILDGYGYVHDPLGLRTNITRYLGMTTNQVAVGYDNIGQIISWRATEAGGTARQNEQQGWGYDKSGNLQFRTNGALRQTFVSDPVNQLTNVGRTGNLTVSGATAAPVTNLTVNGVAAQTYGDLSFAATNFVLSGGLNSFTNLARNVWGTNVTNIVSATLPASLTLQFDLNGNLTNDGTRTFVFDAENRLVTNYATGVWKSEFVYDGLGRRRIERDYGWTGSSWSPTNELHFIYDGWLLVQVQNAVNTVLVTYTRGLDLSGTDGGAGGIGGVLARTDGNGSMFYHADGVGNITALVDSLQLVKGRYLYNPFGRVTAQWGPMAPVNEIQFSSMWLHRPSGMSQFLFRDGYDPSMQRWIQQDPIGEAGGINLYGFVGNNPIGSVDPYGLDTYLSQTGTLLGIPLPPSVVGYRLPANPANLLDQAEAVLALPAEALLNAALVADFVGNAVTKPITGMGLQDTLLAMPFGAPEASAVGKLENLPALLRTRFATKLCPAAKEGQLLYRGVWEEHPAFDKALQGSASPRGGNIVSPVLHNEGYTDSIFTSWTTDPALAAERAGPGGVVLQQRFPASRLIASPDRFGEGEVLVLGRVKGATVTPIPKP